MAELITLDYFGAAQRQYHIYIPWKTAKDGQEHYHDYYQLCYVALGAVQHHQGQRSVRLTKGDAFLIPPGYSHNLHFPDQKSSLYSLAFQESLFHAGWIKSDIYKFLMGLQKGSDVFLRVSLDAGQQQWMEHLLNCLIDQQNSNHQDKLTPVPSMISAAMCLLAQCYYRTHPQEQPLDESDTDTMAACIRYIEEHYRLPLSIAGLARQMRMSRSAFCSAFTQYTGMPLRSYIAEKRIREAQRCIRTRPELTLGQIAREVGYEDASTFYRNFLRIAGMSPAGYRHQCRCAENSAYDLVDYYG